MRVRMYLVIRELQEPNRPAMIERRGHRSLLAWDPRNTRREIVGRILDVCTAEEVAAIAEGMGFTFPLPVWTTEDRPATLYVPVALRLPGHQAIQGGDELFRRPVEALAVDLARADAEAAGTVVDLQEVDDLAYFRA